MWLNILIGFLTFVIILVLFLLLGKFTLNIGYLDKKVYTAVYIFKLKVFSSHKEYKKEGKIKREPKEFLDDISNWKAWFDENKQKIGKLLNMVKERVEIRMYSVFLDIGVGNSMATGLVCGAASIFLGTVQSYIDDVLDIYDKSQTRVNPIYNKYLFDMSCNVVINFKIIRLLKVVKEIKKSGVIPKEWNNG